MRLHKFFAVLITLLMLSFSTALHAQDGGLLAQVTIDVNLRSGPGTDWRVLETITAGRALLLDGHDPSGLWARGITSSGTVGWTSVNYLSVGSDQVLALPQIWVDTPFVLPAPSSGADGSAPPPPAAAQQTDTSANTAPAEAAAPVNTGGGLLVSSTTTVNLRETPSASGTRITAIPTGTPVLLDGRDSTGAWVRGIIPSGRYGWLSSGGVNLNNAQLVGLPIITAQTPFLLSAPASNAQPAPAANTTSTTTTTASSAPIVPIANTAPVAGFSYGGHVNSFSGTTMNAMRRAGMTWAKVQFRYQGQDASAVAGLIADAHNNGMRILLGIVGMPGDLTSGGYYDRFAAFAAGAAALGADAIEVWNEPNIDREWTPGQINPASYTELLRVTYYAIKGANPNTLVISGAPAPTGFFGGCHGGGCDDNLFVQGMAAAGAANYMDCVGIHYNEGIIPPSQTSGDPRGNSSHYSRYFWGMINTYSAAFRSRPLCFTELGYLTPEGYGGLPGGFAWASNVTVSQQAAWLDSAVSLSRSSGRVRLLIVWNVDFTGAFGEDPIGGYAIIRPDGSCPACDALGS